MDFEQTKEIIVDGLNHPYILFQKIHIYCQNWGRILYQAIRKVEQAIENKENNIEALTNEEEATLAYGAIFIPAIILQEDEGESWKLCQAIGMMLQNYGEIFENNQVLGIAAAINKMIHTKDSLSTLLIQTEGVILQLQSALNNTDTPYKLSRKFLTSLFNEEND